MVAKVKGRKSAAKAGVGDVLSEIGRRVNEREKKAAENVVQHAIAQGLDLIEAQKERGSRKFAPWLKKNVEFSRQTVYTYMHIAEHKDAICKATLRMRTLAEVLAHIDTIKLDEGGKPIRDSKRGKAKRP